MAKILIRSLADAPREASPDPASRVSGVDIRAVLAGPDVPLHLHRLLLRPAAWIAWNDGGRGLMLYVKSGVVQILGQEVGAGGAITVEHGAKARLTAVEESELLMFQQGPICNARIEGAGGHVHILVPQSVPRRTHYAGMDHLGGALFADASCPSCSLWLHENTFMGHHGADLHTHSEDEVIVVLAGEVILGKRNYPSGTVIAVAANTVYGFATGHENSTILNFRPAAPTYRSRKAGLTEIDERAFHVQQLGSPIPCSYRSPSDAAV